ncbi:MAG: cellulase family glycosylhydrolase [Spirochaetales bacterium]|nr:cellulase family glycosylhydrolase [Spirochaetales bacterium]
MIKPVACCVFLTFLVSFFSCISQTPSENSAESAVYSYSGAAVPVIKPWRGFNLLGKFTIEWSNAGYSERDFKLIHELGFNFVRLPVDYRFYTRPGDWNTFVEPELEDFDKAVEWGHRYGIHVCLNLHRAPGFCVNPPSKKLPPNEDVGLWEDTGAQKAFIRHWSLFAERYASVSGEYLSFNLVNEPSRVDEEKYARIMRDTITAIRILDENRPILVDGLEWGTKPVESLMDLNIIQALHDYQPFTLTHYRAEWADGSDSWPVPAWPELPLNRYLYGPAKPDFKSDLVIKGKFPAGTRITFHLSRVSDRSRIVIKSGSAEVFDRLFVPGKGAGEWEKEIFAEKWGIYQNMYNKDYTIRLPDGTDRISVSNEEGDWCTFTCITFEGPSIPGGKAALTAQKDAWGVPQAGFTLLDDGSFILSSIPEGFESAYKPAGFFSPWINFIAKGGKAFVGEMGVYRYTPHDVTLRYLKDQLAEIRKLGIGWAFWNFRGPFGPLDSERADVKYEYFEGHKLDGKMLELLGKY